MVTARALVVGSGLALGLQGHIGARRKEKGSHSWKYRVSDAKSGCLMAYVDIDLTVQKFHFRTLTGWYSKGVKP